MSRPCFILFFLACAGSLAEQAEGRLSMPEGKLDVIERKTPMPELENSRVGKILNRYYQEGLGGAENWEKIISLKVSGRLKSESGTLTVNAYQKKPNLIKMVLIDETSHNRVELGYDGKLAWKREGRQKKPEPMSETEARRFIHQARFGNYLLYPYAEGKGISLIDTVPVEGKICHQIRVELDTGFQIDYFIDIRSYLEIKVTHTDKRDNERISVIYKDYIREFGMPIAKKIENYEKGEWVSSLTIDEVKVNSGIMPWMFHMPR